jgi:hypothetical protein
VDDLVTDRETDDRTRLKNNIIRTACRLTPPIRSMSSNDMASHN